MSNSKIISYDLCAPSRNYDDLYEYIKSFDKWAHIAESAWFIVSSQTCHDIRNDIAKIVDDNDRIFVASLTGEAAWHNAICKSQYLKDNL